MLYSGVSWAIDLLAHLLYNFVIVLTSFLIIPHCLYPSFHLLSLLSRLFLCLDWYIYIYIYIFIFQCIKDSHIPLHSYLVDISLKILSWKGHLIRESSYTSMFESVSILLCILSGAHLLIFRTCTSKKKKRRISACLYVCIWCLSLLSVYIGHWGLLYWFGCLWKFVCELSKAFTTYCLSHYVLYVWETSDLFLGTPDHFLLHHYIHWWFDRSPWLDLSKSLRIHFLLISLFLSWYLIRLVYIVLCLYRFTFLVRYFAHIILIHPINSSIFFLYFLS